VDTRHHPAAEAITARLVTVVAEVAATAHPAVMVAAIAAVGVADILLEAEAAALLPAVVVIPLEEITVAITKTKKATAGC
jgi:hypothetical protein